MSGPELPYSYRGEKPPAIAYRDFVPRRVAQPTGWFWNKEVFYETLDEAVEAANRWIGESNVRIINVETVVLPNIWEEYEEGTTDAALRTHGETSTFWHQFIRVWYEVK